MGRIARESSLGLVASALVLVAASATAAACARLNADCTCAVEQNGERRTLVCGETSCVGGVAFACGGQDEVVQRGPCTATPRPTPTPEPTATAPPPPDWSCDDLRAYCSTSCSKPAAVAADCQATAGAGDPARCSDWLASQGALCRP